MGELLNQKEAKWAQVMDLLKEGAIGAQATSRWVGVGALPVRRIMRRYEAEGMAAGLISKKSGSASRVVPREDAEAARTMGLKDAARAARPHPGARYAGVSTGTAFFESMPRTRTRPPKLSSRGRRGKAGNEGIHAHSPQAKGRVERPNLTLKVRLIKEIRLTGINDMECPSAWLPAFVANYYRRVAVLPCDASDVHLAHSGTALELARTRPFMWPKRAGNTTPTSMRMRCCKSLP